MAKEVKMGNRHSITFQGHGLYMVSYHVIGNAVANNNV